MTTGTVSLNFIQRHPSLLRCSPKFTQMSLNIQKKNTLLYNKALGNQNSNGEILITKNSGNSGLTHVMQINEKIVNEKDIVQKIEIIKLDNINLNSHLDLQDSSKSETSSLFLSSVIK